MSGPTCPSRCGRDRPRSPAAADDPATYIDRLERWCDQFSAYPPPDLESFILPGGSPGSAHLHVARTVARRAERAAWAAADRYGTEPAAGPDLPGGVNPLAMTYLNRLSDLLFILTRAVNGPEGDVLWVPGRRSTIRAVRDHLAHRYDPRTATMREATGKATTASPGR